MAAVDNTSPIDINIFENHVQRALEDGMHEKAEEFREKGGEIYNKVC